MRVAGETGRAAPAVVRGYRYGREVAPDDVPRVPTAEAMHARLLDLREALRRNPQSALLVEYVAKCEAEAAALYVNLPREFGNRNPSGAIGAPD